MDPNNPTGQRPEATMEIVLEDFTPASRSLDWRLGQAYWRSMGVEGFRTGDVPNLLTGDGYLASRAARVLYANCLAAQARGELEDTITIAELGAGPGLFARVLLGRFKALCEEGGQDFFHRLTFYITDHSAQTLVALQGLEGFEEHRGRVRFATADALSPGTVVDLESGEVVPLVGLRAVFHTYLLCVLPFALLKRQRTRWLELHVQTGLAEGVVLDSETLVQAARQRTWSPEAVEALMPLWEALVTEQRYLPVDSVRYSDELERFLGDRLQHGEPPSDEADEAPWILSSEGALDSLVATVSLLCPGGFILFGDYGWTEPGEAARGDYQYFGGSTAMGLNFPWLDQTLKTALGQPMVVSAPEHDEEAPIHMRCLSLSPEEDTHRLFRSLFDGAVMQRYRALVDQAASRRSQGDGEGAIALLTQAREICPWSWVVLCEWAATATGTLRDPEQGLARALEALTLCPDGVSALWNEAGEALYILGRVESAHTAFLRGRDINPHDPRTMMNLAWTWLDAGHHDRAARAAAEGLILDRSGRYRELLFKKLRQILEARDRWSVGAQTRSPVEPEDSSPPG